MTAFPRVSDGGAESHLISTSTDTLSTTELLDFMDTQPLARDCVPKGDLPVCADDQTLGTTVTLPPRGPAIAMSAAQWGQLSIELQQLCRDAGSGCSYETIQLLQRFK